MLLRFYDFPESVLLQESADVAVQFFPEATCGTLLFTLAAPPLGQAAHRRDLALQVQKDIFHIDFRRIFSQGVASARAAHGPQDAQWLQGPDNLLQIARGDVLLAGHLTQLQQTVLGLGRQPQQKT